MGMNTCSSISCFGVYQRIPLCFLILGLFSVLVYCMFYWCLHFAIEAESSRGRLIVSLFLPLPPTPSFFAGAKSSSADGEFVNM